MAKTYFTPEASAENPHFCIIGKNNDSFVSDAGQKTGIEYSLAQHLKENGFEAVIFYDAANRLYCYDEVSYQVLRYGEKRQEIAAQTALIHKPARRRTSAMIRVDAPVQTANDQNGTVVVKKTAAAPDSMAEQHGWNLGRMTMAIAWQQVNALLNAGKVRIALVFANIHSLQFQFPVETLQVLEELAGNEKHSIVVYLFRSSTLETICRAEGGCGEWSTFYHNILYPCLHPEEGDKGDHVILIGTANAAEIRNLLLFLRSREQILIRPFELEVIAKRLAAICADKRWSIEMLRLRLCAYSGEELTVDNAARAVGEQEYQSAMDKLNAMIGLESVKADIRDWAELQKKNTGGCHLSAQPSSRFAPLPPAVVRGHVLNRVLKGGAGTGKTALAKLHAQLYFELGLLPKGQCIPVNAGKLISSNVGGTAENVHSYVKQALGGVLFIDETYALMDNSFGKEAIDQLVADMSEYAGQFAVLFAGYPKNIEILMKQNEGLPRRFPTTYMLPDYTPQELLHILCSMAQADKDHVSFAESLMKKLPDFCEAWYSGRDSKWGNAGECETLLSEMKRLCAAHRPQDADFVLTEEDIPERLKCCMVPRAHDIQEALKRIESLIGLNNVKTFLLQRYRDIIWGAEGSPGHYIFAGAPGTGKTFVARQLSEMLYLLHIIRRNVVIEVRPDELLRGNAMKNLQESVERASGAVWFLDEAHQLCDSAEGRELVHALVPIVEHPDMAETCFILAGYAPEMERFLAEDAGLNRRFPERDRIFFHDYTADELTQILQQMAQQAGDIPTEDYLMRSRAALEHYLENRPENFGNAGYIRQTFLPQSCEARSNRLNRTYANTDGTVDSCTVQSVSDEEKRTLTAADLPRSMQRLAGPLSLPVPPERTPERRVQELIAKQEVADYIEARRAGDDDMAFYDTEVPFGIHFAVAGAAGTGRRTTVRTMAAVWKQLGLLARDDVVFVSKGDLEAGYVGQTRPKTRAAIARAVNGTLCVLQPSSMLPRSAHDNSFGMDALGELTAVLGRDDISLVLIDTEEGMRELFSAIPDLENSLTRSFHLRSFTAEELNTLFVHDTQYSMVFSELDLQHFFKQWLQADGARPGWGNGNEIRTLVSELKMNWKRLHGQVIREHDIPYRVITAEHFPKRLQRFL